MMRCENCSNVVPKWRLPVGLVVGTVCPDLFQTTVFYTTAIRLYFKAFVQKCLSSTSCHVYTRSQVLRAQEDVRVAKNFK